jgi:hypothetical protein
MLNQRLALTALVALTVIGAAATLADDFDLNWWTVDGGGTMWSTGGGFELSGTIGQPDAGAMTGGGFELTGGFWVSGVAGPAICPGDMNCDGRVTFADIDRFVEALAGESAWNLHHPDCPWLNADCNNSGTVTFADIDPFVAVIGTTCP